MNVFLTLISTKVELVDKKRSSSFEHRSLRMENCINVTIQEYTVCIAIFFQNIYELCSFSFDSYKFGITLINKADIYPLHYMPMLLICLIQNSSQESELLEVSENVHSIEKSEFFFESFFS